MVEVVTTAGGSELVADRLFALGASAVSERPVDPDEPGRVVLVADLPAAGLAEAVASGMEHTVVDVGREWRDAWRPHARAWPAGRFLVRPPWVDAEVPQGAIEVVVDPGDAFGSGSHATTRLCLEVVGDLVQGGERVLDVGCGSGVLGVAALLAGAESLRAVDLDPAAVAATADAAGRNGVAARVRVDDAPVGEVAGEFDLVLANLLVDVLEQLGPALVAHVAPGGALVASGVLESQVPRVEAALRGLVPTARAVHGEWMALVFRGP